MDLCCFFSVLLRILDTVGKDLLDNRVAVELKAVDVQPQVQRSSFLKGDNRAQYPRDVHPLRVMDAHFLVFLGVLELAGDDLPDIFFAVDEFVQFLVCDQVFRELHVIPEAGNLVLDIVSGNNVHQLEFLVGDPQCPFLPFLP